MIAGCQSSSSSMIVSCSNVYFNSSPSYSFYKYFLHLSRFSFWIFCFWRMTYNGVDRRYQDDPHQLVGDAYVSRPRWLLLVWEWWRVTLTLMVSAFCPVYRRKHFLWTSKLFSLRSWPRASPEGVWGFKKNMTTFIWYLLVGPRSKFTTTHSSANIFTFHLVYFGRISALFSEKCSW